MCKNKKVVILSKSIDGGTGTYVFDLLNLETGTQSFQMTVLVLERPSFRDIKRFDKKIHFFRNDNHYKLRYVLSVKNILGFFEELVWFWQQLELTNPDVVIGVDFHCNLIISVVSVIKKGFKKILTSHINLKDNIEQRSSSLLKKIFFFLTRFFYNRSDRLVFVSKELENAFKRDFSIRPGLCQTIYHGLDNKLFAKKPAENFNKKTLITVARLVEQKDYRTLLLAFSLLVKKLPSAELQIVSRGAEEEEIKTFVAKNGLSKHVRFLGWVENVFYYLKRASVFVFSSKREGFGYAIIEAMSQGVPIISTNTPYGPKEILAGGKYGVLVPLKDEKKLARSMYKLLINKSIYNHYATQSLKRAKYFSLNKTLYLYKKLIFDLINKQ